MQNIMRVTQTVKEVLIENENARNSDDCMYVEVIRKFNSEALRIPFGKVLADRKKYGVPCFESCRRARQRLQAEFPDLGPTEEVAGQRGVNEKVMREYAKASI